MDKDVKVNLLDYDRAGLEVFFAELGEKPFRTAQVMKWMYHEGVTDFAEMTNLSKVLREKLNSIAEVRPPKVSMDKKSEDGTRKWLLEMGSGNLIETVFIPETERGTLCVSSQVGCALECPFCSTAQQGFNRNLSTAEIIGQVWQAHHLTGGGKVGDRALTNVVMMGMGEPLANFTNVVKAMNLMQDDLAFGISKRRVTLSTSGVVPALYRLKDVSDVSLAVSLHAATNELRDEIVPINKKYPIAELLDACRNYIEGKPHRSITWEYVMLEGVNDSEDQARALARCVAGIPGKINLIPFNPFPDTRYKRSSDQTIRRFRDVLVQAGAVVMVRKTRGDDIDAACGQLAGQVQDKTKRRARIMMQAAG